MSSFKKHLTIILVAWAAWQYYTVNYPKTKSQPRVEGFFLPAFRKVAETFRANIESGAERGSAFAVFYKGKPLVDMWGGWADLESERPWQENTMTISFSMVKGVAAICLARLVDMGLLDYKKEVYHYWPDFAANDKTNVTVEMLLSHRAGLIGLDELITMFDYRDNWDKVEKILAKQKPFWPPGTGMGYHSFTYGMYADALLRKVDPQHRNLSQFFQDEIAVPLDIEFYIGLPPEKYHRYAKFHEHNFWMQQMRYMDLIKLFMNPFLSISSNNFDLHDKFAMMNNPDILSIGVPSMMGVGTPRSLAKLYDFIANGGSLKAKQLLSPQVIKIIQQPLPGTVTDHFRGINNISRGFMMSQDKRGHERIGHTGFGGSIAYADMTIGAGCVYSTNHLSYYLENDPREIAMLDAFYESFDQYMEGKGPGRGV